MDDLEPLIILYEEHELCRKSNLIQFLMHSHNIDYVKITAGSRIVRKKSKIYCLPVLFIDNIHFGGFRQLKDFLYKQTLSSHKR